MTNINRRVTIIQGYEKKIHWSKLKDAWFCVPSSYEFQPRLTVLNVHYARGVVKFRKKENLKFRIFIKK